MATSGSVSTRDLIRAWALDQRRRGLQESTIAVRGHTVRHLADWLGERGLLEATADDVQLFLDGRRVIVRTRRHYLSSIAVFYSWALFAGLVDQDPTAGIVRPRVRPGLPRPISDSDLDLALCMSAGQVRLIVALAAFEGLRCCEIARLARDDILDERRPPMLVARGKGDKLRVVPLHEQVWRILSLLPLPRTGPVLRARDGRPYNAWEVSHIANCHLHGLGIDATVHQCRHWFGTETYRTSGNDLLLVRDLMGHESVETTKQYAAFDRAGAVGAVERLEVRPGRERKHGPPAREGDNRLL